MVLQQNSDESDIAFPVCISIKHEDNLCKMYLPLSFCKGGNAADQAMADFMALIRNQLGLDPSVSFALTHPVDLDAIVPLEPQLIDSLARLHNSPFGLYVLETSPVIMASKIEETVSTTALYDYKGDTPRELSFSAGDEIQVTSRFNDEWLEGRIGKAEGLFPANYVSKGSEILVPPQQLNDWQDDEYFESYANLTIHLEMLSDTSRTLTYKTAIENVSSMKGKTVLDIGCGSGILSMFCVLAGAKHVYAVDASAIADEAEKAFKDNGMEDKITLLRGKIEEIELPVEKVDFIVSEWMGTMLICESMVASVLDSRAKFLAPDGMMLPASSDLYLVPVCLDDLISSKIHFWDDVYGVKMSSLKRKAHKEFFSHPIFDHILQEKELLSHPQEIYTLDMHTGNSESLERIESPFVFHAKKSGVLHGFGTWFDSHFLSSRGSSERTTLSTSPFHKSTHWRNVTFVLEDQIELNAGEEIRGTIVIARNAKWRRHFEVTITWEVPSREIGPVIQIFPLWR